MKYLFFIVLIFLLSTSCSKEDEQIGPGRTVLIYMSSDSRLEDNSIKNLRSLQRASSSFDLKNNKLIIYVNRPGVAPVLIKIHNGIADTVKTYDNSMSSGTKEVLEQIISEVRNNYQSETYGLLLWGHGMNWLSNPSNTTFRSGDIILSSQYRDQIATPARPTTKHYGYDKYKNSIEIVDLQNVIPENVFDYIMFDACYMSSIEIAYTLRSKSPYIVASAAEVWDIGFPYQDMFEYLFSQNTEDGLRSLCDAYFNYYVNGEGATERDKSATISLVSTSNLEELAQISRDIIQETKEKAENLSLSDVQRFDRKSAFYKSSFISYDFRDYVSRLVDGESLRSFESVLNKVILRERHTDSLFRLFVDGFDVRTHCGLTIYPYYTLNSKLPELSTPYQSLDWYKAVYE